MADPPLKAHSVRIAKQLYTEVKDKLHGLKAVVVQHNDTEGEHVHMYYPHDLGTAKTAKQKLLDVWGIKRSLTNGDWGWSDPGTLQTFWSYAMSGYDTMKSKKKQHIFDGMARTGATCIVWGIEEPRLPDFPSRPETPIVSTMNVVTLAMPNPKKSINEQFLKHCQDRFEGREYVDAETLVDEFVEFFCNGKSHYRMLEAVRYAEWCLNDTPEYHEAIKRRVKNEWLSKI